MNTSNSEGQILAVEQGSPESDPTNQNLYTSNAGATVTVTRSGNTATTTYPAGQVAVTALSNGQARVHISATAGACPDGTRYVDAAEDGQTVQATVTLDAQGNPTNQSDAIQAENLQQMLWCRTATVRNNLQASADIAGLDTSLDGYDALLQSSRDAGPYGVHPQVINVDCGIGIVGTALGFASWIAMPLDPLAYWGMTVAYIGTARACGWA